jgi:IS1 family transposase
LDELCISKKRNLWLWTAVSRYTGQVIAWVIGSRQWHHLWRLWEKIPSRWRRRLVYTDGYGAYSDILYPWQHRVCQKFDGGTCTAEGVNNSLRHRCSALVRRTSAKSPTLRAGTRSLDWLSRRVLCAVLAHNKNGKRRLNRRLKIARKQRS